MKAMVNGVKNMKWIFFGAGIIMLAALFFAGCGKHRGNNTDDVDGGVVTRESGDDAPKVIESTEINTFECIISLLSQWDPGELKRRVYTFSAELKDEKVFCSCKWRGDGSDSFSFESDISFLKSLQNIVSEYDFAQYNGFYHSVSGLPNMYGDRISIVYESGEEIYASDNQSGFLPNDAAFDLVKLFCESAGKVPSVLPIIQSKEVVAESENGRSIYTVHPILSLTKNGGEEYGALEDAVRNYSEGLRTEYRTNLMRLRQAAKTVNGDFTELYSQNEMFVTKSDSRVLSFYEKRTEFEGWLDTMYWWDAHTFDSQSGKELGFADVFTDPEQLPELLYLELESAYPEIEFIEETPKILKEVIGENNTAVVSFSLSPGYVNVFFTDYRFTLKHTGGHHIALSFKDYPELVKPEFRTNAVNYIFKVDYNFSYPLSDGIKLRTEYIPSDEGEGGNLICRVNGSEYSEKVYDLPNELYLIRKNGRYFLYMNVPTGDASKQTNVYEVKSDGLAFVGKADMAMAENFELDPDRIRMVRLEGDGEQPTMIYGICKVGNGGMPVWIETVKENKD